MEVLDPSVSNDDRPLCLNDNLQKVCPAGIPVSDTSSCIKTRKVFGFLGFLGFALVYAMRVNLSITIVAMVNKTQPLPDNGTDHHECPSLEPSGNGTGNHTIIPSKGSFDWNDKDQSIILGAFFLGYVLTNVPGGRLAEKVGGKLVYGLGVFLTSILTIISPFAAMWGFYPFLFIRIAEGITEGVTFPSMHSMLAQWVPPLERSKFAALVYAGSNFGTIISMPLTGWLCDQELWDGWPLSFYLFGSLGIVWYVFWLLFVFDTPAKHPTIDPQERAYIESLVETKNEGNNDSAPWGSIIRCLPLWAIAVTQCGQAWAFYTLLTKMPTYMNDILRINLEQNAFESAMPYLTAWIMGLLISALADALLAKNLVSTLTSFKLWNTVASLGPSLSFLGAIWAGCDQLTVMIMLSSFGSLCGAAYAGNQMNHIALSPRYAGTLYGMTNALANACGFLAPYAISLIIGNQNTMERWHIVFLLAAIINVGANCFYLLFASAKEQSWNRGSS